MIDQWSGRRRQDNGPRPRGAQAVVPPKPLFSQYFRQSMGLLFAGARRVPWIKGLIGALVLVISGMLPWGTGTVLKHMDRPIDSVLVDGSLNGESLIGLQNELNRWRGQSFFVTDLNVVKHFVEARPWVESAAVSRKWPDEVVVDIREHEPLAYWNDNRLVSRMGVIFSPPNPEAAGDLPQLSGPDERVGEIIRMAQELSGRLQTQELSIARLDLETRGAWTLRLSNGIAVVLGRDQVGERFERFLTVYSEQLADRVNEVVSVDARYTNGVAVQWKDLAKGSGEKS